VAPEEEQVVEEEEEPAVEEMEAVEEIVTEVAPEEEQVVEEAVEITESEETEQVVEVEEPTQVFLSESRLILPEDLMNALFKMRDSMIETCQLIEQLESLLSSEKERLSD